MQLASEDKITKLERNSSFYRDSIIEIVMQDDFNLADLQLLFQQINSAKARELMGPPCSTRNPGPPF